MLLPFIPKLNNNNNFLIKSFTITILLPYCFINVSFSLEDVAASISSIYVSQFE